MKITLYDLPDTSWKAIEEFNYYELGKGIHLPDPRIGFGLTAHEALENLLTLSPERKG